MLNNIKTFIEAMQALLHPLKHFLIELMILGLAAIEMFHFMAEQIGGAK